MRLFAKLLGVWIGAMWLVLAAWHFGNILPAENMASNAAWLGVISGFWLLLFAVACAVEKQDRKKKKGRC